MEGCHHQYGDACYDFEESRLRKNARKPCSMANYTSTGFVKTRAPQPVANLLQKHWLKYRNSAQEEKWRSGDTRSNHWVAPTYMVNLYSEGFELANEIFKALKPYVEEWTGMEQRPVSLYGIRVYTRGAILAPHVDRYQLISSAIINVAQDVEEPWPLEVIDRDSNAINITMNSNDMVLYESHSLIRGRPFALNGSFMANVFCHFEPTGRFISQDGGYYWKDSSESNGLPPYIIPGSAEEDVWRQEYPNGWYYEDPQPIRQTAEGECTDPASIPS